MLRANVWKQRWAATSVALLAGIALAACGPPAPAANVTAVTLGNTGAFGNGTSNTVMASQDGNLVAFLSASSDQLVDLLCEYMENGCKMKPKYVERVEDFYQFDDHNNCERIYNEIIKYQQQVNKDKLK